MPRLCIVYFQTEAEHNSELSWSRWILNSLIYTYSGEFIFHDASKHAVFHLYFCDNTMICLADSSFLILRDNEDWIFLAFFPLVNIGLWSSLV